MDHNQLGVLVLYGVISVLSTKISDEEKENKCMYILVINSLALLTFSQYLRDVYYFLAFVASGMAVY